MNFHHLPFIIHHSLGGIMKTIAYGKGQITFNMSKDPLPLEKIEDPDVRNRILNRDDIITAIRSPEGTPSLHESIKADDRVILLVPDVTRRAGMDQVLPRLVDELENIGVSCENITLLFATGLHGSQTREEKIYIIGEDLFDRLPNIFDHDADDQNNLAEIGEIRAWVRSESTGVSWKQIRSSVPDRSAIIPLPDSQAAERSSFRVSVPGNLFLPCIVRISEKGY